MTDLVEFLRARLDEAETAAQQVRRRVYVCEPDGCIEQAEEVWADGDDQLPNHHGGWHLICDPVRVLAEVEAKRRMLDWALTLDYGLDEAMVLRLLALPYAAHPDHQAEWAP